MGILGVCEQILLQANLCCHPLVIPCPGNKLGKACFCLQVLA